MDDIEDFLVISEFEHYPNVVPRCHAFQGMIGRRCGEPRLAPTLKDPSGIDGPLVQDRSEQIYAVAVRPVHAGLPGRALWP
jgi:hypothetical protein